MEHQSLQSFKTWHHILRQHNFALRLRKFGAHINNFNNMKQISTFLLLWQYKAYCTVAMESMFVTSQTWVCGILITKLHKNYVSLVSWFWSARIPVYAAKNPTNRRILASTWIAFTKLNRNFEHFLNVLGYRMAQRIYITIY